MSEITRRRFEQIIFKQLDLNVRFTQDSPVYPDVWLEYFETDLRLEDYRADLILTPHRNSNAAELYQHLATKLRYAPFAAIPSWEMASNGETVVARLTLFELVILILPMTSWWHTALWKKEKLPTSENQWLRTLVGAIIAKVPSQVIAMLNRDHSLEFTPQNLQEIFDQNFFKLATADTEIEALVTYLGTEITSLESIPSDEVLIWSVNRNRPASITLEKSVVATKADSSRKLFEIDGSGITWAVLDTGIDATHPAFRRRDPNTGRYFEVPMGAPDDRTSNYTRVVASYDFTKFRAILSNVHKGGKHVKDNGLLKKTSSKDDKKLSNEDEETFVQEIDRDLRNGRLLDWTVISPLLRIPHNDTEYDEPLHPHGTHVAGIIASNEVDSTGKCILSGMCPGISLYDIRVLDAKGAGEEFNILAALQFIRWLNNQKEGMIIHGINLSFSMIHSVASYACGATPVCESCNRLVSEGTVVVAAAGNQGQAMYVNTDGNTTQGFRMVNITDPGNAAQVITVGSTHRERPHEYGVSYFSSKGPTGDGRVKPDLVAPGEKIISCVLNGGKDRMDGTSMAAPHVSGAAALLLARHRELIGKPSRIKEILCSTATDLKREKYFQGCGMVDVLRAIQSI